MKPHPQDFTLQEIMSWIGTRSKKDGVWQLWETEAAQFDSTEGVVRWETGFRYTKWTLSETGFLRWEQASRSDWEKAEHRVIIK